MYNFCMEELICTKCGKTGDSSVFTKRRSCNGTRSLCKSCKSEMGRDYRERNKERLSLYFSKKWRDDENRRKVNKLSKEKKRTGMNASEYVKDKCCELCGMTNIQHFEKYNERLHIHHKKNNGRKNIRLKKEPVHEELQVLCRSCHVTVDNRMRAERRRTNAEL